MRPRESGSIRFIPVTCVRPSWISWMNRPSRRPLTCIRSVVWVHRTKSPMPWRFAVGRKQLPCGHPAHRRWRLHGALSLKTMRQQTPRTPRRSRADGAQRGRPDGRHHGPLRAPRTRTDPCAELRFIQHQVCGVRFLGRATAASGIVEWQGAGNRRRQPGFRRDRSCAVLDRTGHGTSVSRRTAPHPRSCQPAARRPPRRYGRPPYRPRRQQILHARAPGRKCPGRPQGYIPLAPLHQPFALEAVEILLREQPDLPQMALLRHGLPPHFAPGREDPAVALCRMGARSASVRVSRPVV